MLREVGKDTNYWKLDDAAKKAVVDILKISARAKVIILIEDNENSMVSQSPDMQMLETLGLLQISIVRCNTIEAESFKDRISAAKNLTRTTEISINKGKAN